MHGKQFSAFALLVIALFMFVACDDEPVTEPAPVAPLSDLEWTTSFRDAWPIGRPIFAGEGIIVPTKGAFDVVKVDSGGAELWRQAFDYQLSCASYNNSTGIYIAGYNPVAEETFAGYISNLGEQNGYLPLTAISNPVAVVARSQFTGALVIGSHSNASHLRRVGCVATASLTEITGIELIDEPGDHNDFVKDAIYSGHDGCFVYGTRVTDVGDRILFLMRLNENGSLRWEHEYGISDFDEFYDMLLAENGDVVGVGCTNCRSEDSQVLLMRIDRDGAIVWQREWEPNEAWSIGLGIAETEDSFLIAGGTALDSTSSGSFISEISLNGEPQRTRLYSDISLYGYVPSLAVGPDGATYLYLADGFDVGFSLSKLRQPIFPEQ